MRTSGPAPVPASAPTPAPASRHRPWRKIFPKFPPRRWDDQPDPHRRGGRRGGGDGGGGEGGHRGGWRRPAREAVPGRGVLGGGGRCGPRAASPPPRAGAGVGAGVRPVGGFDCGFSSFSGGNPGGYCLRGAGGGAVRPWARDSTVARTSGSAPLAGGAGDGSWGQGGRVLYKFSRPHTMLGTFAGVLSTSLLAWVPGAGGTVPAALGTFQALVAALLMNVAIVGVNQVYDVEIDRINKPYLPLASGEMSMAGAVRIVVGTAASSLAIGVVWLSPPLLATLGGSLLLGLAYSTDLPGLRWKRSPAVAAACIMAVRSFAVHVGFFAHVRLAQGLDFAWTPALGFAVAFMLLFSIVIAFSKDIPDVEGDRIIGIRTLSVRVGTRVVFRTCIAILLTAYAGAVAFGAASSTLLSRFVGVLAHAIMGALLVRRAREVDTSSKDSLYSFYMFLWKLFYAEYAVLPFLR